MSPSTTPNGGTSLRQHRLPRLYVEAPLGPGVSVALNTAQSHYLRTVLRLDRDDGVRLFNGVNGEWRARLEPGRQAAAVCEEQIRPQQATVGPRLLYAPVKKEATDFIVQKAVELGCTALQPVLTSRTQSRTIRQDRLLAQTIEAAEQCERLDLPSIAPPRPLSETVARWPPQRQLFVALERSTEARPALSAFLDHGADPAGLLIGPEGGLSPADLEALAPARPIAVSLGPRVLRAETAAVAMMAIWQAAAEAGRRPPSAL